MSDDNVTDLAQKRLERSTHLTMPAVCMQCGHKWVAVAPVGTYVLECPSCHVMKGVAEGFVKSEHPSFTCNTCFSNLFTIPWRSKETIPHILCAGCGMEHKWEDVQCLP